MGEMIKSTKTLESYYPMIEAVFSRQLFFEIEVNYGRILTDNHFAAR